MIEIISKAHKKPQCVAGKASKDAQNKAATSCVACLQQKKCCKKNVINHAMQDSMGKSTIKLFNHVDEIYEKQLAEKIIANINKAVIKITETNLITINKLLIIL